MKNILLLKTEINPVPNRRIFQPFHFHAKHENESLLHHIIIIISNIVEITIMSDKKYPKDLEDVYYTTKSEVEQKLAETEVFVTATNMKSLELMLNSVHETNTLVGDFVNQKVKDMEKFAATSKKSMQGLNKSLHDITTLQTKLGGLEKSKELDSFKKQVIDDLNQEVRT